MVGLVGLCVGGCRFQIYILSLFRFVVKVKQNWHARNCACNIALMGQNSLNEEFM